MFRTDEQERRVRRSGVYLLRRRTRRMEAERFREIAGGLGLGGDYKLAETEEALAVADGDGRALVYAQPGSRLGGVLFYTDQTRGVADRVERGFDAGRADRWAGEFLRRHDLSAGPSRDERVRLSFELSAAETAAVVFDGKERRREPIKTDVTSRVELNGVRVMGPRAKVRMVFKDGEAPLMIHCGLWEGLEVYEERDLVAADEVAGMLRAKLSERRARGGGGRRASRLIDVRLAYFAGEYEGGPDLLLPYYFVTVEQRDAHREDMKAARRRPATQGPRQVFQIPAFR